MWRTPTFKEVAVGLEINCYACAEIQKVADNKDDNIEIFNISLSQDLVTALKDSDVPLTNNGKTLSPQAKKFIATYKKMGTKKAYGGKIKKKMMGGMVKKKMMAGGGKLKNVPSGNKGLGKLPTSVRNKMGFKASGGKVKKTYAKGGGIRKANYK